MPGFADRSKKGLDGWATDKDPVTGKSWADRFKDFFAGIIGWGIEIILDVIGKAAAPKLAPLVKTIEDTGAVPPELQPLLDELKTPTGEISALLANSAGGALVGGAVGKILDAVLLPIAYAVNAKTQNVELNEIQYIALWLRGNITDEELNTGFKHLGQSDIRIDLLKELAKIIPPLPDMVRFADYSSFDPEVIAKWRDFYDAPGWITQPFSLLGVTNEEPRDWANKYWFSHWIQPGRFELGEMYRRGELGTPLLGQDEIGGPAATGEAEDIIKLAYKTMGYSSFWQDRLLNLVREIPTRVDVRRWWDMGTIDEEELRSIYQRHGYFGKDLENYVIWTKVYVAFPDLISRWQKGWISLDDVREELTGLGMPADRVETLVQTKIAATTAERTATERDITKSDIIKGVKTNVITRGEGVELLLEMGYDEDEAVYILEINIPMDEQDDVVAQRLLSKSDILKGLKTEEIDRTEALVRLRELRYSPPDAELLLRIYEVQAEPPEELRLKEASKADIVLGVKKGLITQEEGYGMLLDIGFSDEAAEFILMVKTEESPFSPVSYDEFKERNTLYRRATGMVEKPMPEELKAAADELVKVKLEVEALERAVKEERGLLMAEEEVPETASKKLTDLQVTLNRARAELQRIQLNYNSLVAQWKHGSS